MDLRMPSHFRSPGSSFRLHSHAGRGTFASRPDRWGRTQNQYRASGIAAAGPQRAGRPSRQLAPASFGTRPEFNLRKTQRNSPTNSGEEPILIGRNDISFAVGEGNNGPRHIYR